MPSALPLAHQHGPRGEQQQNPLCSSFLQRRATDTSMQHSEAGREATQRTWYMGPAGATIVMISFLPPYAPTGRPPPMTWRVQLEWGQAQ